ncbi:hypothetical protein NDU88_001122 [Pleurodeles waltl]|uniref:Uncharacterized protein n=1 Tax=Pleurodeles waltl TaxID=8319 RepID=A0AAV7S6I9_PLEWA|nr:hypothetical protein NDU88_001122 [Pleurodeles waltl]
MGKSCLFLLSARMADPGLQLSGDMVQWQPDTLCYLSVGIYYEAAALEDGNIRQVLSLFMGISCFGRPCNCRLQDTLLCL